MNFYPLVSNDQENFVFILEIKDVKDLLLSTNNKKLLFFR